MERKIKYAIYTLSVLVVLVVVALFMIGPSEKETKIKTNLGYKQHLGYLPLFVGIEKGFYAEQGLDVNSVVFDSTNQMVGAVVSGNIDAAIGSANLETTYSVEEKSPGSVKIFTAAELNKDSALTCVLVKKDSDINNILDLKNKKVATMPGTFSPLWTEATLKTVGIDNSDIKLSELASNLQLSALESQQIDALFTIEPVCTFGVNQGIAKNIYKEPLLNLANTFAASIMSADLIKKDPDKAKKIIIGTDKAIEFIKQNPEESITIMTKYTGYKPELVKGMKPVIYLTSTKINVRNLQDLADTLFKEGILTKQINTDNMIYR